MRTGGIASTTWRRSSNVACGTRARSCTSRWTRTRLIRAETLLRTIHCARRLWRVLVTDGSQAPDCPGVREPSFTLRSLNIEGTHFRTWVFESHASESLTHLWHTSVFGHPYRMLASCLYRNTTNPLGCIGEAILGDINPATGDMDVMLDLFPPDSCKCLVLQTNIPPLSTNIRECRNAKLLYKCLISPPLPACGPSTTLTISFFSEDLTNFDAKNEEEKQVTEQTSLSTNEENVTEDKSQNNEDSQKFSEASELYRRSSRVFDNIEDAYASDENSDILEIDLGENILCDAFENTQLAVHEESSNINSVTKTKEYNLKDTTGSDLSLLLEDTFLDNVSDVSDATFKKSQKSSKISIPVLQVSKKVPVCNETFADFSNTELTEFPNEILNKFSQLKMLYVADNNLTILPAEVFTSLKYLEWLDIRNNQLSSLPKSIESHPCIETLLLQGNKIEELPLELCTLTKLKTLQVMQNPLITPPKDILVLGCREILEYLRTKWNNAHPERQVEFKENKVEPKLSMILCYQSPRKCKKKITSCKNIVHNRNVSTTKKRKFYKPSNRCKNKGTNILMEHHMLYYSKVKELFSKQALIFQKLKDQNVLKEWRQDKRSFNVAMEKAMRRNTDDIPFGFDLKDYASILKQKSKLENLQSRKKGKQKFIPPENINQRINEVLESMNQLEIKITDEITPRTKQNLLKSEMEKILQFQIEIQNLRKYNDIATVPLKY
ncbi:uncharacterized protein LOC143144903 [Ptiloglossa arizonensis]|uniref:uncharacterized protein LOC143144903 n=1 Tax=Ptiloglossa arizonensis TaxID=3350558 RepID=UPI003FA0B6F7